MNETLQKLFNKLPFSGKNSECTGVYSLLFYMGVLIVIYFVFTFFFFKKFNHRDYLNQIVYRGEIVGELSWWPISHFILYFIIGLFFPNCDLLVIFISFAWEGFEEIMGIIFQKYGLTPHYLGNSSNVQYTTRWWKGSWKDIAFNLAGFYSAKGLVKLMQL